MGKWNSMLPYFKKYLALNEKKTMSVFCREQGIDYDTFRSAKLRYMRKEANHNSPIEMAPVLISSVDTKRQITPASPKSTTLYNFSIHYANGVSLNLASAEISTIAQLINLQAQ